MVNVWMGLGMVRVSVLAVVFATLTACGGSSDSSSTDGGDGGSVSVPTALQQQYTLDYSGEAVEGWTDGQSYTVVIGSDSGLTIGGTTFSNPTEEDFYNQGKTEIVWSNGDYRYILSTGVDGGLNEINLVDFANPTNGFPTFKGQFAEASSGTEGGGGETPAPAQKTFSWWKLSEDSNKVAVVTSQNYLASASAQLTEALVKDKAKLLMPMASLTDMVVNQTTATADEVVYALSLTGDSNATYYNAEVTYRFEKLTDAVSSEHGSGAPSQLTSYAGTYSAADTALPAIMGSTVQGHLTLDLTIDDQGLITYVVKDKDDDSVIYSRSIQWDGEFDEVGANNSVYLNRLFSDTVYIVPSASWFEFHIHMPLYTSGVSNGTTNIQWNLPYVP